MFRVTESRAANKALVQPEEGRWTRGLFECCLSVEEADEKGCEFVMIFPAVLHGRVGSWLRGDSYRLSCCTYAVCWAYGSWLFAAPLRTELRQKYSLPAEPWSDCMVHLCCSPCAVWQEYRELEAREGVNFYLQPPAASQKEGQQQQKQQQEQKQQEQEQEQKPKAAEQEQQPAQAWQPLETEQKQQHDAPGQASTSEQAPPAGSMWRKLDPAESYKKRSVEIEEVDKVAHIAAQAQAQK